MTKRMLACILTLLMLTGMCAAAQAESGTTLKEAPILSERVASGELDPVEKRMPVADDILVETVTDEIGQYGGELTMMWKGSSDRWYPGKMTEEPLFRFKSDGSGVEPCVAKGYDVSEDSRVYTIYLREGMRWSDGVPFTADDVVFYWEHMLTKETFGKKIYDCYYSVDEATGDRQLCSVEKVDDYTVRITHVYPSAQFLERVAIDNKWFFAPKHFHETILAELIGEEAALAKATEMGFSDISAMGKYMGYYYWIYPQVPTLRAWVASNDPDGDKFIMTRNPYYWKTDAEGNQLPYIDSLEFIRVQDDSHIELAMLSGELDMAGFGFEKFTMLKENEGKGNYSVKAYESTSWSSQAVQLNQTCKDLALRELFQDIRFREALSVAADRVEITELVMDGLADPIQSSVPEGLVNYQEGWAEKWAAYDPDRANALLDEIGLPWDAKNEFRTHKDGSELTLTIQYVANSAADKTVELLKKYYEAVGIATNIKPVDDALFIEMKYSNDLVATMENIACFNVSLRPDALVPLRTLTPWLGWYGKYNETKGAEGVEPTGDIQLILDNWAKLCAAKTPEEIESWGNEIIKLHAKNNWVIGYAGPAASLQCFSNTLHNVPETLVMCDEFRDIGHAKIHQFFFK